MKQAVLTIGLLSFLHLYGQQKIQNNNVDVLPEIVLERDNVDNYSLIVSDSVIGKNDTLWMLKFGGGLLDSYVTNNTVALIFDRLGYFNILVYQKDANGGWKLFTSYWLAYSDFEQGSMNLKFINEKTLLLFFDRHKTDVNRQNHEDITSIFFIDAIGEIQEYGTKTERPLFRTETEKLSRGMKLSDFKPKTPKP